ncbi:MAG: FliH/SctL family protein [Fimbriimonadaceae bacterium]
MSRAVINPEGTAVDFLSVMPEATGIATRNAKLSPQQRYRQEGVDLGFQEGYQQGLSKGRQDGIRMALEETRRAEQAGLTQFLAALNAQAMRVSTAVDEFAQSTEEPLSHLAATIAARIIGREIKLDPDTIVQMTRQAISEAAFANNARVKVNPFDEPALRAQVDLIMTIAPTLKSVDIIADDRILAGCLIETDLGVVDATVTGMLTNALQALREAE